jgi:predicted PurR-regulated permease PerM
MENPDPAVSRGSARPEESAFLRRTAVAVGLALAGVVLLAVAVLAAEVLLAIFAGLLLAIFLLALRDALARLTRLPPGWALASVVLVLTAAFAAWLILLVPQLAEQAGEFRDRLPGLLSRGEAFLEQSGWGRQLLEALRGVEVTQGIRRGTGLFFSATLEGLGLLITFLAVGLFIAANSDLYTEGMVRLFPLSLRDRAREVLGEIGYTLRRFLVARAIAMSAVGLSTAVALLLLGVPLALLLGVIAGILTFAPYFGPIAAGVPIVVVALMESPEKALYALVVYTLIQNLEGVVFDPLILQRAIRLPPVVTLGSQMVGAVLLGPLGLALATPFTAVLQVLVRRVYREDILREPR